MSQKLYANPTVRKAAYRARRRERERIASLLQSQEQVPVPVPVRSVDQVLGEIRTLAAICDRGCSRLAMDRKPWMLRALDASRAHELLRHIQSELNRLAR